MKLRLHEIELGCHHVQQSTALFQSLLGLTPKLSQKELSVLDAGVPGLDFSLSTHLPAGVVVISFLTDDLDEIETRLKNAGIPYEGPRPSHLGMVTIEFKDANGYLVRVNTAGKESPSGLQAG